MWGGCWLLAVMGGCLAQAALQRGLELERASMLLAAEQGWFVGQYALCGFGVGHFLKK